MLLMPGIGFQLIQKFILLARRLLAAATSDIYPVSRLLLYMTLSAGFGRSSSHKLA